MIPLTLNLSPKGRGAERGIGEENDDLRESRG